MFLLVFARSFTYTVGIFMLDWDLESLVFISILSLFQSLWPLLLYDLMRYSSILAQSSSQ